MKAKHAFAGLTLAIVGSAASAATIAELSYSVYVQDGTLTNNHSEAITQMVIDFIPDAGTTLTPLWDTGTSSTDPNVTFDNLVPNGAFTAIFSGLNVATGGTFNYGRIDYDGWNGTTGVGTPIPNLQGDEVVTLTFASGATVSTLFSAGFPYAGTLLFDDANLVTGNGPAAVPLPASLPMLIGALGAAVAIGRRKQA
ncbi:MAG: putative extracellular protein [Rhodobacteraceae bacterium HLUCCA08]|nr:MAG: putative extracellular protein [Rhodobacteraceae bacterium HLUCCA08]